MACLSSRRRPVNSSAGARPAPAEFPAHPLEVFQRPQHAGDAFVVLRAGLELARAARWSPGAPCRRTALPAVHAARTGCPHAGRRTCRRRRPGNRSPASARRSDRAGHTAPRRRRPACPAACAIRMILRDRVDRPQRIGGIAHRQQARLALQRLLQIVQLQRAIFHVEIHPADLARRDPAQPAPRA